MFDGNQSNGNILNKLLDNSIKDLSVSSAMYSK